MAYSIVQSASISTTTAETALTVDATHGEKVLASALTIGNAAFVFVTNGTQTTQGTVTDTGGNTYVAFNGMSPVTGGTGAGLAQVFWCPNLTSSATGVTYDLNAQSTFVGVAVVEVSGLGTTANASHGVLTTAGFNPSVNVTNTANPCLVLAFMFDQAANDTNVTPSNGTSISTPMTFTPGLTGVTTLTGTSHQRILTNTTTNCTFTAGYDTFYGIAIVVAEGASGGGIGSKMFFASALAVSPLAWAIGRRNKLARERRMADVFAAEKSRMDRLTRRR